MKTRFDPRHRRRIILMQAIFAWQEDHSQENDQISPDEIVKSDLQITQYAPKWPLSQINKIDLAVLRIAFWELRTSTTPPRVVIDEAIEIAKEFGAETSSSFVNGVLGAWAKENVQL